MEENFTLEIDGEQIDFSIYRPSHWNGPAIEMTSRTEGPVGTLSVNLKGHPSASHSPLDMEREFVLHHNYMNPYFDGFRSALLDSDYFEDTGKRANFGYVTGVPIWRLTK